jgi:hypothetical protein
MSAINHLISISIGSIQYWAPFVNIPKAKGLPINTKSQSLTYNKVKGIKIEILE